MAMQLASTGVWIVLWSKTLPEFWTARGLRGLALRDHMAMPSSPLLRKKELVTRELVTPEQKLSPSAIVSTTIRLATVRLFIGPSSHRPTFVWWMYRPLIVESLSAPPTPFAWSRSIRLRTSPSIAKPDMYTLALPPSRAYLP